MTCTSIFLEEKAMKEKDSVKQERHVTVKHVSILDDPGYETDVKTYEDEEGILYDNLD